MNVLVTGGGGFLGRHIVTRLLARGDRVRILNRSIHPELARAGVSCKAGDLVDGDVVARTVAGMDAVIHVGAKAGIWGDAHEYFRVNVIGTRNILTACKDYGVRKLVYTSTPSVVYSNQPIEGGDESLPRAEKFLTPYAATKAEAERIVLAKGKKGLAVCALRPHLIFGPGDTNIIPKLCQRAKEGRLRRVGDGHNLVSVAYVENVADAHLAALDRLEPGNAVDGQAYFINEPEPVNCWDFISRLLKEFDLPKPRWPISGRTAYAVGWAMEKIWKKLKRDSDPPMTRFLALQLSTSHWFKIDKARRDLGWEPKVPLDEAITRTARSMKNIVFES